MKRLGKYQCFSKGRCFYRFHYILNYRFNIHLLSEYLVKLFVHRFKKNTNPTIDQFNKYPGLKYEVRSLNVGDFTWVARHKQNPDQEIVLPFIVERKRMDDFAASIKDGRFHEQKFRLRKCGLHNVIYLVEDFCSNKNLGLPLQSLKQALANTIVQDGFTVHSTDSLNNSVRFLAMMTKRLTIHFKVMYTGIQKTIFLY